MAAPYCTTVIEQWIDYNGHLNEGYFGVVFADASDDLLEQIGFDAAYRDEERGTFYTVESHIRFLKELSLGDELRVDVRIIGLDDKRLHTWHEMYRNDDDDTPAATQEAMLLHVDVDAVRVRPMSTRLYRNALAELDGSESKLPQHAGRAISALPRPLPGTTT